MAGPDGGLHERTELQHEVGGLPARQDCRADALALDVVYYDDLDAAAYNTGVCVLRGDAFGRLWDAARCAP